MAEVNNDLAIGVGELGSHIDAERQDAIRELLRYLRTRLDRMDKIFGLFDELTEE